MANFSEQNSNAGRTPEDIMGLDFVESVLEEFPPDPATNNQMYQGFRNDQYYGRSDRVESQAQEVAPARDNGQYAPRNSWGKQATPAYENPQNAPNETLTQSNNPMNIGWAEQQVTNLPTTESTSQIGRADSQQNYTGRMEVSVNQQNFQQTVQKANFNPAPVSQAQSPVFANRRNTMETAKPAGDSFEEDWKDVSDLIDTEKQSDQIIDLTKDEPESIKAFNPPSFVLKKPGVISTIPQGMTTERRTISDIARSMRIYEDSSAVKNFQSTNAPASQAPSTAHTEFRKRKAFVDPRDTDKKVSKNAADVAHNASNFESAFSGLFEVAPQQNNQAYPDGCQPVCNIGQNAMHVQQPSQSTRCGSHQHSNVATDGLSQTHSYVTNSIHSATPIKSDQSYPGSIQSTQQKQPTTRGEQSPQPASMDTVMPAIRMRQEAQPIRDQAMTVAAQTTAPLHSHAQPLTHAILTDNPLYYTPPDNTQSQSPITHANLSSQYQPTFQGPLTHARPSRPPQLTYGAPTWESETSSHATYNQTTHARATSAQTSDFNGHQSFSTRAQQQKHFQQLQPNAVSGDPYGYVGDQQGSFQTDVIASNESELKAATAREGSFSTNFTFTLKYHKLVKNLAVDNGFGLIRQDRMKCGGCSIQHMIPDVLEKDAKDVAWHSSECRYFNARKPCQHCVRYTGHWTGTECVGCEKCCHLGTSKTFIHY